MNAAAVEPRYDEHRARKEYLCADPDNRGCSRRILPGELYVQISYPPYHPRTRSPEWTILRCCDVCMPPAGETSPRCSIGSAGQSCLLDAGHLERGLPHEYPATLF